MDRLGLTTNKSHSLGNLSFVNFVGLAEPDWACTMPNGQVTRVNASLDKAQKCDLLKQCTNFTAIKNSTNFHSILAQFKMICDDSDKPRNIQLILAGGLVSLWRRTFK